MTVWCLFLGGNAQSGESDMVIGIFDSSEKAEAEKARLDSGRWTSYHETPWHNEEYPLRRQRTFVKQYELNVVDAEVVKSDVVLD